MFLRQLLFLGLLVGCFFPALAQNDSNDSLSLEEMSKKRQDPVAGLKSIYLQNVMLPVGDGMANSFTIQPVFPVKLAKNLKIITYSIIPFQSVPSLDLGSQIPISTTSSTHDGKGKSSGLGNILLNGYFTTIEKKSEMSLGLGPSIQLPTRTDPALGSNRVSMGPSALVYYAGDVFSGGVVVQNYWSLGGEGINKVNTFSLQYMAYYNFNEGLFAVSNTTMLANWLEDDQEKWFVPLGAGLGKLFKIGKSKLFYCFTGQAFYNVVKPESVGDWEAIFQVQVIF